MLPDRVSNPGPLIYESGALPIALHGPAAWKVYIFYKATLAVFSENVCQKSLSKKSFNTVIYYFVWL